MAPPTAFQRLHGTINKYQIILTEQFLGFFRAGRSAYIFVSGILLLVLGGVCLVATFDSREAAASPPGWPTFVAATGSNQWLSTSFLISSGCIVLSINYLPRLEGES